jgi:cytochrome c-type biogenesis protein CcmH/NrfG
MNGRHLEAAAEALHNAERLQPDRPVVKETAKRLQSMQADTPARNRRDE